MFCYKTTNKAPRHLERTKSLWTTNPTIVQNSATGSKQTLLHRSLPRGVLVNFRQNAEQQLVRTEQHKVMESHPSPVCISALVISRMKPPVSLTQAPPKNTSYRRWSQSQTIFKDVKWQSFETAFEMTHLGHSHTWYSF